MKITGIKVRQVEVPLVEPLVFRSGLLRILEALSCRWKRMKVWLVTEKGRRDSDYRRELIRYKRCDQRDGERYFIGVDPTDLEKVYWTMDHAAAHSGCAKNAIDMACYDLLGKKAGMPVYKLLGGYRNYIETDMTVGAGIRRR